MDYEAYLSLIAERSVGRYNIPALFDDPDVLDAVISDLAEPFLDEQIDVVAGLDALGFVLGTGVALELGVGFLPIRKGGKLPIPESDRLQCSLVDYTGETKVLELDSTCLTPRKRVLVVDDWIETAAQMEAATTLVEEAGSTVVGVAVLNADENERSNAIAASYGIHTLNPEATLPAQV